MKDVVNVQMIKQFIEQKALSKTHFCKLCKISVSTLNRIYCGKDFNLLALFRVVKVMGVRVCELFNKYLG